LKIVHIRQENLLPGEHELMKQYDASRDTVSKALSLIAQNGYIQKAQGKGSVVLNVHQFEFPVGGVVSFQELAPTLGKHVSDKGRHVGENASG
jgi:GntR family trehalose operon transcriptional repressor